MPYKLEKSGDGYFVVGPSGRKSKKPLDHATAAAQMRALYANEPGLKSGGSVNFIKGAIKHPGALHRDLGVPEGETIPASKLAAAAKRPGKVGQRARFAETLKGLPHHAMGGTVSIKAKKPRAKSPNDGLFDHPPIAELGKKMLGMR